MKVRDYYDCEDDFEMEEKTKSTRKKQHKEIDERKDQKRYKKSKRVYKDKFFKDED